MDMEDSSASGRRSKQTLPIITPMEKQRRRCSSRDDLMALVGTSAKPISDTNETVMTDNMVSNQIMKKQ